MQMMSDVHAFLHMQGHAEYEHRLQQEVTARLLKEQELQQLVSSLDEHSTSLLGL